MLVTVLLASFVLMLLSSIFFAVGLPEVWARGLFMTTVVLWFALGIVLMADSIIDTRRYAKTAPATSSRGDKEKGNDDD